MLGIKAHAGTAPAPPVDGLWLTGVLLLNYIYIYIKNTNGLQKNKTHRQVLILGSLDYETNVFPLHHGASEPF